jgi:site-specific DNA-methyltransferase (adenine-specific)
VSRRAGGTSSDSPFYHLSGRGVSECTLWNEDCVAGLPRRLPAESVSVVVTSPPYNRGIPYASYADSRPRDAYLTWMGEVSRSVDRVLEPGGSFFLNLGSSPKDPWIPWDVAGVVRERFVLQNVIHWVKSIVIDRASVGQRAGLNQDLAVGHYKPVQSSRYLHGAHEYIFHFTHAGDVPVDRLAVGTTYQDKSNIARWSRAVRDRRCRGNTWFLPYATIRSRAHQRPHPASFPPELAERCILLHGVPRTRLVADPFLGIGSAAVAAQRLRVPFVGFEIDREYLAVACSRLRAHPSKEPSGPRTVGTGA